MQAISMPIPGFRFRPDIPVIANLLPDVKTIELSFIQPTPTNPMVFSDIADEAIFTFDNDNILNLKGYLLWKFRDMIPEQLGSMEHGYDDTNIYSSCPSELLMVHIRHAYGSMMLKEEGYEYEIRPPISAKIDLKKMTVDAIFPAELSGDVIKSLSTYIENNFLKEAQSEALSFLQNLIKTALKNKHTRLERYDVGNNMLGQKFVQYDWEPNAVNTITFKEFCNHNAPDDGSSHLLQSYIGLIIEKIQKISDNIFVKALDLISQESPHLLIEISTQLRFNLDKNSKFKPDEAIKALSLSRDNDRVVNMVSKVCFSEKTLDMTLSSYLKLKNID